MWARWGQQWDRTGVVIRDSMRFGFSIYAEIMTYACQSDRSKDTSSANSVSVFCTCMYLQVWRFTYPLVPSVSPKDLYTKLYPKDLTTAFVQDEPSLKYVNMYICLFSSSLH